MAKLAGSRNGPKNGDYPDVDLEEEDGRQGKRRNRRYRFKRPHRKRTYFQK